jgi:hypothetical protein
MTCIAEKRNAHKVLVGKPEENRPFWRLGHKQNNNIKTDSNEIRCEGVDWICLAQDWDQKTVMHHQVS